MQSAPQHGPEKYAYPMLLDVSRRKISIIGGGSVAARKAAGLIDAGAKPDHLRVVAPQLRAEFAAGVVIVAEEYHPRHLDGAELVFAATDSPQINARVADDAHARGLLICRADLDDSDVSQERASDFITPAKFARGAVTVAISAGGSPALAAAIRDELARRFDPRWALLAAATQLLRPQIRQNPRLSPRDRQQIFRELASHEVLDRLPAEPAEVSDESVKDAVAALADWLKQRHPELELTSPTSG